MNAPIYAIGRFYRIRRVFNVLTLKTNTDITVHGYFGAALYEITSVGYPPQPQQKLKHKVQLALVFGNKVQNVAFSHV